MHTARVLPSPFISAVTAPRHARWIGLLVLTGSLAGLAPLAKADEFHTVVGAGVGAVAGAFIGQSIGGRNGAIVGAGAGGLVGASLAQRGGYYEQRQAPVQQAVIGYPYQRGYAPNYPVQAPVAMWQAPAPRQYGGWREVHDHGRHYGSDEYVSNRYEQRYVDEVRYAPPVKTYGHDRHDRYERRD
jgi:hypothetical protein